MATITHYASLVVDNDEIFGTAELVCGSGWLFRKDGERQAILVSWKNPELLLLGRCDIADAQAELDGNLVLKTSRTVRAA